MENWSILSFIILGLLTLLGLILVVVLMRQKKNGQTFKTDYRSLFVLGIIFMGAGVTLAISIDNPGMYGMTALGFVYLIAGLANRDKWENNQS